MYDVSNAFILYLVDSAPSLFYNITMDCISFRWKIPTSECLGKWTSKRSGLDIVEELRTREICGFIGMHFPGKQFFRNVAAKNPGPYTPWDVFNEMNSFLVQNGESFGKYYEEIKSEAKKASEVGCVFRYADEETEEPMVLTAEKFFLLFPDQRLH